MSREGRRRCAPHSLKRGSVKSPALAVLPTALRDDMRRSTKEREQSVEIEYLRAVLSYNPFTGSLVWRRRSAELFSATARRSAEHCCANWNSRHENAPAGSMSARGYLVVRLCGTLFMAHRVAWAIETGEWPHGEIDHIDGQTGNLRFANLRLVDRQQNMKNRRIGSHNTSGFMGLRPTPSGKWCAYIHIDGRQHSKTFASQGRALSWRKSMEREHSFHQNHGRAA